MISIYFRRKRENSRRLKLPPSLSLVVVVVVCAIYRNFLPLQREEKEEEERAIRRVIRETPRQRGDICAEEKGKRGEKAERRRKKEDEAKKRRNARFASVLRFLIFNRVSAKSRISSSYPFSPPSLLPVSRHHTEPPSAGIKFTFLFYSYYVTSLGYTYSHVHTYTEKIL